MLKSFLTHLNNRGIVLASNSQRRKQILQDIVGLKFEVVPSRFEENLELKDFSSPGYFVMETAKQKALAVAAYLEKEKKSVDLVIGADTVVIVDGEAFGKPEGNAEALGMLERLSGRSHEVVTGVALILPLRKGNGSEDDYIKTFYETTTVTFARLTADVIHAYVETGEPLDKAGAYGIQGIGGTLIERIQGDYYNVVGFPLHKFCKEIYKMCSEGIL